MFNESMMRTLSNIELKISEENNRLALASKDNLIQKKTIQTYFLIAIVLIVVIFSIVLFRSYKLIKEKTNELARSKEEIVQKAQLLEKANNDIQVKNEELEHQTEEIMAQRDRLATAQEMIESKNKELEGANLVLEKEVMIRTNELSMAVQDLRESNKDLDHFIYRSSHDLKGPLARLLGLSQLGKIETEESNVKDYFEKLELTALEMNEMLARLINIHEISVSNIRPDDLRLKDKISDLFSTLSDKLECRMVRLENEIDADIKLTTDTKLAESLFSILIENAIQFRDAKKNENFLRISAIRSNSSEIQISFVDNGIGISQELAEHIYDMFVMGDNSHKGKGLGLYEAKVIVKRLRGTLALRNSPEGVTKFEITLPLH
jgi:signal transduction histidine kinase